MLISFTGGILLIYYTHIVSSQQHEQQRNELEESTAATPQQSGSFCLDSNFRSFITKTNTSSHIWTPCPWKSDDMNFANQLRTAFLTTHKSTISSNDAGSNNKIFSPVEDNLLSVPMNITFHCYLAAEDICRKAEKAFQKAGEIISSVVLFQEPVNVNATLVSFCEMGGECGEGKLMTLGGSSPARAMPLLNTDGLLRLHPQALVKQFGIDEHPAFAPYDIQSVFNADAPFWFEEDGLPIAANQADFLFVILHEFMHGLGFYSGWNEYISVQALTPDPSPFLANQFMTMLNPTTSAIHPSQFLESAMDRLMIVSGNKTVTASSSEQRQQHKHISDLTRNLNKIQARTVKELVNSREFKEAAKQMGLYATTAGSLQLDLPTSKEKKPLTLETGLKPFQPGSSISHVDYSQYTNSPDFLMRFMQDRGLTLTEALKRGGGDHPIGPLLLNVLEELGYSTIKNPDVVPPLMAFHEQGMTSLIIDNFDEIDKQGRDGLRRKHRHHDTSTNITDKSGRLLSSSIPQAVPTVFVLAMYHSLCLLLLSSFVVF
ncbi:hypothetical protein BDF20DRAFT_622875 [Mycotypha africana]|uniref:uncharacterized protein n=1 Tax=Mycotypha africana TaxID=64632 RepID=UPI002300D1CD|nr:uncharacterized protein BDF20DRAFT_622875 [Mycotypha africana]KAI8975664.1 hypothetical protein BDF20DRAFT_622875 [Mycotypha africana]